MVEIGQIAYEAYGVHRGWKVVGGAPMPSWAEQSDELRAAWNAAAEAVVDTYQQFQEDVSAEGGEGVESMTLESKGCDRIQTERFRQMHVKGWTPEHDAEHTEGELRYAAIAYIVTVQGQTTLDGSDGSDWWPFANGWNPSDDPIRNLTKAGALIAAEIDRLLGGDGDHA